MEILKTILLRVILLPAAGLLFARTALEIAHANDWYPERQLANLLMASPSLIQIEWVWWGLLAILTALLWGGADYLFYRRTNVAGRGRVEPEKEPAPSTQLQRDPNSLLQLFLDSDTGGIDSVSYADGKVGRLVQVCVKANNSMARDCKAFVTKIEGKAARKGFIVLSSERLPCSRSLMPAIAIDIHPGLPERFNIMSLKDGDLTDIETLIRPVKVVNTLSSYREIRFSVAVTTQGDRVFSGRFTVKRPKRGSPSAQWEAPR
jgi:hypothetical protein